MPATQPYPVVGLHALHEALPPSMPEAERLRLLLDAISKVEVHAVHRHFALHAAAAADGAASRSNPLSVGVQAPLAVADALADWQAGVSQCLDSGALRVASGAPHERVVAQQQQLLARLTAVRDAWAAEEAAWKALETEADGGAAGAVHSDDGDDVARIQQQADAAAAAVARITSGTAVGALASAVEEAKQRLQLQLADMAAAVDGAAALAARGDAACTQLTAVMQATEMSALGVPDAVLDSPQQLMRALVAV